MIITRYFVPLYLTWPDLKPLQLPQLLANSHTGATYTPTTLSACQPPTHPGRQPPLLLMLSDQSGPPYPTVPALPPMVDHPHSDGGNVTDQWFGWFTRTDRWRDVAGYVSGRDCCRCCYRRGRPNQCPSANTVGSERGYVRWWATGGFSIWNCARSSPTVCTLYLWCLW